MKKTISNKVSLIIFFTGLSLSLISSINMLVTWSPMESQVGLFASLPVFFWIGVLFIFTSFFFPKNIGSKSLIIFKLGILYGLFNGIPSLFLSNIYRPDTHFFIDTTKLATIDFSVPISISGETYVQFPGAILFFSSIQQIVGVSFAKLATYYPIVQSVIVFLCVYFCYNRFNTDKKDILTLMFFTFGNVYFQFHMVPQSLTISILLIFTISQTRSNIQWRVISIITFIFLTITHPPTALFALCVTFFNIIYKYLFQLKINGESSVKFSNIGFSTNLNTLAFSIIIWIAWLTYIGSTIFNQGLKSVIDFLELEKEMSPVSTTRSDSFSNSLIWQLTGSSHHYASLIRFLFLTLTIVYSSICLWILLTKKKYDPHTAFATSWLVSSYSLIFFFIFSKIGLGDRIYLYILLISPLILFKCLELYPSLKWKNVISFVIILVILIQSSTYYKDSNEYTIPDQSVALSKFLDLHVKGYVTGGHYIPQHKLELPFSYFIGDYQQLSKINVAVLDPYLKLWVNSAFTTELETIYKYYSIKSKIYDNNIHTVYLVNNNIFGNGT